MTYCLAIAVKEGLVFASDSRTNAGVDQVSTYTKMFSFNWPGERTLVLLSAGNLGTTQAVVQQIELDNSMPSVYSLANIPTMAAAAEYIGKINLNIQQRYNSAIFEASFILGGQLPNQPPELYLIYPQGNYILHSPHHPFLQIGEVKYGKPILDRIIREDISLEDAARCAIVSLDSTMHSNVSVGFPIDLRIYRKDSFNINQGLQFNTDDPFYLSIRNAWTEGIKGVFDGLPRFDWE